MENYSFANDIKEVEVANHADLTEEIAEKGDPRACLFVASLNAGIPDNQLTTNVRNHFCKYGQVLSVKVLKDSSNRPYAFVQFKNVADAERALQCAQSTILDDRSVRIERAKVNRTLFVARLSQTATEPEILQMLNQFGEVEELKLFRNTEGQSRGMGFVRFKYREDAINAFTSLRKHTKWIVDWKTQPEHEQYARSGGDNWGKSEKSIFVGNLNPQLITADYLRETFGQYGEIEDLSLFCKTLPNRSFAFAYIKYKQAQEAQLAIKECGGTTMHGRIIRVQERHLQERQKRFHSAPPAGISTVFGSNRRVSEEWAAMSEEIGNIEANRESKPISPPMHLHSPVTTPPPPQLQQAPLLSSFQESQQQQSQNIQEQVYGYGYYYPPIHYPPHMFPMDYYYPQHMNPPIPAFGMSAPPPHIQQQQNARERFE